MATKQPRIITTHDWISVDFGNGRRLTASRSGEKGTGAIPHEVFRAWSKMICEESPVTIDDRIAAFVARIDSIWPEWDVPPRTFTVGESVSFDFGKRGGVRRGTVVKVSRTNYTVDFVGYGKVSMAGDLLATGN